MTHNLWYVSSPVLSCWSRFWGFRDLAVFSQAACAGPFDLECSAASSRPAQSLARSCRSGCLFSFDGIQRSKSSQLRKATTDALHPRIKSMSTPNPNKLETRGALLSTRCLQKVPLCFARARPDPWTTWLCGLGIRIDSVPRGCNFWILLLDYLRMIKNLSKM